jgi:hypothetical protein
VHKRDALVADLLKQARSARETKETKEQITKEPAEIDRHR